MAQRCSRATGVGRGNGLGSRSTQFGKGEPSRNPNGRPKKDKAPVVPDMRRALRRALERRVPVTRNGVVNYMLQVDAMAELMVSKFADCTSREQMQFMRMIMSDVLPLGGDPEYERPTMPSDEVINEFIHQLARESGLIEDGHGGYMEPPKDIWGAGRYAARRKSQSVRP